MESYYSASVPLYPKWVIDRVNNYRSACDGSGFPHLCTKSTHMYKGAVPADSDECGKG